MLKMFLITGGAGYIGSQLIRDIAKNRNFHGSTVRILDNMLRERYCSLWDLPSSINYEFIEGDIRESEDVRKALKDVDIVFHLADVTNAAKSFENEKSTKQTNYEGLLNLFNNSLKSNVKKFVYASSASLYGPTTDIVTEEYECKPISPYGKYKLMAEKEIMDKGKKQGMDVTSLRFGTIHGWSIGMRFDTVIDRFVYLAVCGAELPLWETALNEKRPYLHIKDAIRSFIFATEKKATKGQIYNIVSQNVALMEVVEELKKYFPDLKVKITPTPNLNQVSYILSNKKILDLGFQFRYTISDGIKEIVDKFKAFKKN